MAIARFASPRKGSIEVQVFSTPRYAMSRNWGVGYICAWIKPWNACARPEAGIWFVTTRHATRFLFPFLLVRATSDSIFHRIGPGVLGGSNMNWRRSGIRKKWQNDDFCENMVPGPSILRISPRTSRTPFYVYRYTTHVFLIHSR